jgi:hypothetical protein
LEVPEFYVVYGYDDTGYFYSGPGCDSGRGPKPWRELGDTGIGVLELYSLQPGKTADDETVVKQAFDFVLKHASNNPEWIFDGYRAGLEGYDNWISALKSGNASEMGMRYNGQVWHECRQNGVAFLEEAKQKLPDRDGGELDDAISSYTIVSDRLGEVAGLYPWDGDASDEDTVPVDDRNRSAVKALSAAREAEERGLAALQRIAENL